MLAKGKVNLLVCLSCCFATGCVGDKVYFNQKPEARIKAAQTVVQGQTMILSATSSFDPEGSELAYSWTLVSTPSRSQVGLADPHAAVLEVVAAHAGRWVVQLAVDDGLLTSDPEIRQINVVTRDGAEDSANTRDSPVLPGVLVPSNDPRPGSPQLPAVEPPIALPQNPAATSADIQPNAPTADPAPDPVVTPPPDPVNPPAGNPPRPDPEEEEDD